MHTMRDIRDHIAAMIASEQTLQKQRDARAAELYANSQYMRILGMLVGLGLVALAVILLRRDLHERARAAKQIFCNANGFVPRFAASATP